MSTADVQLCTVWQPGQRVGNVELCVPYDRSVRPLVPVPFGQPAPPQAPRLGNVRMCAVEIPQCGNVQPGSWGYCSISVYINGIVPPLWRYDQCLEPHRPRYPITTSIGVDGSGCRPNVYPHCAESFITYLICVPTIGRPWRMEFDVSGSAGSGAPQGRAAAGPRIDEVNHRFVSPCPPQEGCGFSLAGPRVYGQGCRIPGSSRSKTIIMRSDRGIGWGLEGLQNFSIQCTAGIDYTPGSPPTMCYTPSSIGCSAIRFVVE